jgi:hypothetical protein
MKQKTISIQSKQFRNVEETKNNSCYITLAATSTYRSTNCGSLYRDTDGKLYTEKRIPCAEIIVNKD